MKAARPRCKGSPAASRFLVGAAAAFLACAATSCAAENAAGAVEAQSGGGAFRTAEPLLAFARAADAIALAEVVSARSEEIDVVVLKTLKGATGDRLRLPQPDFLPTEPRWTAYKEGQRLVLFLGRTDGTWRIRGLSGEGELPVAEGQVYLVGRFIEGLEPRVSSVYGADLAAQAIDAQLFFDAFETAPACLFAAPAPCDAAALTDYAARSPVHSAMAKDAAR